MNKPNRSIHIRVERIADVYIFSRLENNEWVVYERSTEIDWIYELVESSIHDRLVEEPG